MLDLGVDDQRRDDRAYTGIRMLSSASFRLRPIEPPTRREVLHRGWWLSLRVGCLKMYEARVDQV